MRHGVAIPNVSTVVGKGKRLVGSLTLHLLREAVHIIGLIGVSDSVGSHSGKLILVSIATFPRSVDGVPVGKPAWECDAGN